MLKLRIDRSVCLSLVVLTTDRTRDGHHRDDDEDQIEQPVETVPCKDIA